MDKFKKKDVTENNFFSDDTGIKISNLLTLIEDNENYDSILEYFDIKSDSQEFISVAGARTIFTVLKASGRRFKKIDLTSNLKNITLNHKNDFRIKFNHITDNEYISAIADDYILATPIHSGERDFFSNLYDLDKYAKTLLSKGFGDILDKNLDLLKEKDEHIKRYRLIHDTEDGEFYLRAIISEDRYYDYNNNVTLVIALLKLHFETNKTGIKYSLHSCEYNESFIRLFFKTSEYKELKGVGKLENILQVSNDEIKREALRFSNICSIIYNKDNDEQRIFIKPKDIKSKVLSIPHGTGPNSAFKRLSGFVKSEQIFDTIFNDIKSINKIKDHNQIVHLVRSKIENSNTEEIKRNKEEFKKILLKDIKTTIDLLDTFNKLTLLEGLEIDAKEYLRYLIYEVLVGRK